MLLVVAFDIGLTIVSFGAVDELFGAAGLPAATLASQPRRAKAAAFEALAPGALAWLRAAGHDNRDGRGQRLKFSIEIRPLAQPPVSYWASICCYKRGRGTVKFASRLEGR